MAWVLYIDLFHLCVMTSHMGGYRFDLLFVIGIVFRFELAAFSLVHDSRPSSRRVVCHSVNPLRVRIIPGSESLLATRCALGLVPSVYNFRVV